MFVTACIVQGIYIIIIRQEDQWHTTGLIDLYIGKKYIYSYLYSV